MAECYVGRVGANHSAWHFVAIVAGAGQLGKRFLRRCRDAAAVHGQLEVAIFRSDWPIDANQMSPRAECSFNLQILQRGRDRGLNVAATKNLPAQGHELVDRMVPIAYQLQNGCLATLMGYNSSIVHTS